MSNIASTIIDGIYNHCNTSVLESEIDHLVYHLYDLTYDEVLIINPETPIAREQYESFKE